MKSAVAFFVEADLSVVKVSVNTADLRFGNGTFENDPSAKFGVGSFARNHAIKSKIEQPGIDGGFAASGGDQEFVPACLREAERFGGRWWKLLRIVNERAVNVEEDYLF